MKKQMVFVIAIFALLMCTVACDRNDSIENEETYSYIEQSTQPQEMPPTEQVPGTIYDSLKSFAEQSYSNVTLDITTNTQDVTLHASYILTADHVTYSIEQLNVLPTDGNVENVSPEYKTTLSGTAVIENGKVTKIDGEAVNLPSYDELKGNFDFKESNFKNVTVGQETFSADVISAASFVGTDKELHDMKILIEYNQVMFQKITMTYHTANSTVTAVYTFEN